MTLKVPNFDPTPGLESFLNTLVRYVDNEVRGKLKAQSANEYVLLYAPNKDVYKVTVSDTGVLTVVKV